MNSITFSPGPIKNIILLFICDLKATKTYIHSTNLITYLLIRLKRHCKYIDKWAASIVTITCKNTTDYIISVSHFLLPLFETFPWSDCPSPSTANRNE